MYWIFVPCDIRGLKTRGSRWALVTEILRLFALLHVNVIGRMCKRKVLIVILSLYFVFFGVLYPHLSFATV